LKTRLTLKPGQSGTKSLLKKYGEDLVCVRFRYDAETQQRIKTVELVVERSNWSPPPMTLSQKTIVALRIAASDMSIRAKAKAAGARWNPEKQLWFLKYGLVAGTELEKHIYVDSFDNKTE
jgi:hypothetical protein